MKAILTSLAAILLVSLSVLPAMSATKDMAAEFPNPNKAGTLRVVSGEGKVIITGYDGKEVLIDAASDDDNAFRESKKAKGMKRISGGRFRVSTDKDDNAIIISSPLGDDVDLYIKVPRNTNLSVGGKTDKMINSALSNQQHEVQNTFMQKLKFAFNRGHCGFFTGDIEVRNISGEMVLSTIDGDITINDITSQIIANSIDGDITAVVKKASGDIPISFSSIDGDIDVTVPANIKATVTASHFEGDIFTEFDMEMVDEVQGDERTGKCFSDVLRLHGYSVTGKINGGGRAVMMKTIEGDIYIRKEK